MKQFFWNAIMISLIFCFSACSNKQIESVLDDISRDNYEKNMREQRMENMGDPTYKEPPTYDQYQKDRKEMAPDPWTTQTAEEQ